MKLPTGYILLDARLRRPMTGPAALVACAGEGAHGVAPEAILLGAAQAGRRLRQGQALRIVDVPQQTVETCLVTAGAGAHGPIALTARKCGVGRVLWHAVRFFPRALVQSLGAALAGQPRLARLKVAYVLQGQARPISYETWRAVFENEDPPTAGSGHGLALLVIGDGDDAAVSHTLHSIALLRHRPLRRAACTGSDLHARLADLRDDPAVTHIAAVAAGARLSRDALGWALACLEETGADLVYADHDLIDGAGRRHAPAFKPAWNKPLALTGDLLAGLTVLRKDLPTGHGLHRGARPAAQWRRLLLEAAAHPGARIAHIPRILCHLPETAAASPTLDERCAIAGHIDSTAGLPASTAVVSRRIVRRLSPRAGTRVSVIVPTAGLRGVADHCLPAMLANTDYDRVEFIVSAHACRLAEPHARALLEDLRRDARVRIVLHEVAPFNYAAVNNLAAGAAGGDVLCLLNDDVTPLRPDWLTRMLGELGDPGVGAVGARLLYPNGWLQHMGLVVGMMGRAEHWQRFAHADDPGYMARARSSHDVSAVTGACLLVRREPYEALGGLDEAFAISFNDVDFCLRLRAAGWRIVVSAEAELLHAETASLGPQTPERGRIVAEELARFRARWSPVMRNDPHFNPNLSLETAPGWTLAVPPRPRTPRVTIAGVRSCGSDPMPLHALEPASRKRRWSSISRSARGV